MDNFKNKMNEIKMEEKDKERVLSNIMEYKKQKESKDRMLNINNIMKKVAIFITSFCLVGGSAYAAVKIFNIDDKLANYFGKESESLIEYGVGATEISKQYQTDNATITINQTIVDEKEIYISLDIDSKTEKAIYLKDIETSKEDNSIFGNGSFGFAMLEEKEKHTGYVLTADINGKIEDNTNITITLYMDDDTSKDITFKVSENEMKVKEIKTNKVVYNENDITATVTNIRITPLHFIFDIEYNVDLNTLSEETIDELCKKVYNDHNTSKSYIEFLDGDIYDLRLWNNRTESTMKKSYFAIKEMQLIDAQQVKSITINGVEIVIQEKNIQQEEINDSNIKEIVKEVFLKYLYKSENTQGKVLEYRIDNIKIYNNEEYKKQWGMAGDFKYEDTIIANIEYSTKPVDIKSYVVAGNGKKQGEWVTGQFLDVAFARQTNDSEYIVEDAGTGGGVGLVDSNN